LTRFSPSLRRPLALVAAMLFTTAASAAHASRGTWTGAGPGTGTGAGVPAVQMPGPLQQVGYDQKLGGQVPLDLDFHDAAGQPVRLGDFFGRRPVLLVLAYYHCPMLCDLVLSGVAGSLRTMNLEPGKDFDVVVASIDPHETAAQAAEARHRTIRRYGHGGTGSGKDSGWHFLTGPQASITPLAASVGFRYVYDAKRNEFAHAAGIVILTPEGKISRYLYGIEYAPRDVRLALVESGNHKIGSLVDQALLYCFHYDPSTGRYSAMTMRIVRLGGAVTLLAVVLMVVLLRRRDGGAPRESEIAETARP
jgi:protein SCO1